MGHTSRTDWVLLMPEQQLTLTLPARSIRPKMFPRNPARPGTGAYVVFETLANAGGILTTSEIQARCLRAGVSNFRARISDLRDMGIDIQVDHGVYELVRV